MKKIFYTLILFASVQAQAQLTQIEYEDFVKVIPLFDYQGNLFVKNLSQSNQFEGFYKINLENRSVTEITVDETSILPDYGLDLNSSTAGGFNPQFYGDKIYIGANYNTFKLDLTNNTLNQNTEQTPGNRGIFLFLDRLYFSGGYTDLISGIVTNNEQFGVKAPFTTADEYKMLSIPPQDVDTDYVLKQTGSGYQTLQYISDNVEFDVTLGFSPKGGPMYVNGRYICYVWMHPSSENPNGATNMASFAEDDLNNYNLHIFDDVPSYNINHIIVNDGIILLDNSDWYKTDGISNAQEINYMPEGTLSNYFRINTEQNDYAASMNDGNAHFNIGDTTYFLIEENDGNNIVYKIYKTNSIHQEPELIYTSLDGDTIEFANEWQGDLIFYNSGEGIIYRYDGTEVIADPQLNDLDTGGRLNDDHTVLGVFVIDGNILINTDQGLYTMHESQQSTTEQELAKIKIYPNPVKDILYFSEKLSEISIYDVSGKLILNQKTDSEQLNVANLPKGNYILKGKTQQGKRVNSNFIKL